METMHNQTDRFFRERLAGFEPGPDDKVWTKIAGQMARANRKKAIIVYFRIAAGMALLVSLGIGGLWINRNNRTEMTAAKEMNVKSENDKTESGKTENFLPKISAEKEKVTAGTQNSISENIVTTEEIPETTTMYVEKYAAVEHREYDAVPNRESIPVLSSLQARPFVLIQTSPLPFPVLNADPEPWIGNLADFTETEETVPSHHAWIIGSEVAPLFSYRTIASDYLDQSAMESMNTSEDGLFAYAGGISVGYATGRRLRIESGVYYSRYGQEKNSVEAFTARYENMSSGMTTSSYLSIRNSTGQIVSESSADAEYDKVVSNSTGSTADLNNFSGFPGISTAYYTSSELTGLSATQYFDYLEVPIVVKYRVIDRKLGFSITGGLVTNFLVNDGLTLHNDGQDESLGKTSGINNVNYLGSVGLGIDYPIMNKVAFSLTPRFRYYLNPIDKSSQINVHPYSFGIFAGISYTFK